MSRQSLGLFFALIVFLTVCSRPASEPAGRGRGSTAQAGQPTAGASTSKMHEGRGRVVEIDKQGRYIVIRHQQIPGFMDAMTMPFHPASPALARQVQVGDEVEFILEEKPDGVVLTAIRKRALQ